MQKIIKKSLQEILLVTTFLCLVGGTSSVAIISHPLRSSSPLIDDVSYKKEGNITEDFNFFISLYFSKDNLSFGSLFGYDLISIDNCTYLEEIGKPMMPMKSIMVALPDGMKVTRVRILSYQEQLIQGTYSILPAQQPQPLERITDSLRIVHHYPRTYLSPFPYPPQFISLGKQTDLAGQSMIQINVFPLQYLPLQRQLKLFSSMHIVIEGIHGYVCRDYLPQVISETGRSIFEQMMKEMVINPENVELRTSPYPQPTGVPAGDYDYVIITQDSWVNAFQPLAKWKTQKGVPATIVTTNWIYNSGGYSGTNIQKIKAFVQDAYTTWGTIYVLLGGDIDVVPCQYRTFSSVDPDPVPNDAYYADFDSDWICEVNVGRASVNGTGNTTGRIGNFVNKIITYETIPPLTNYAQNVGFFGFDLDSLTHAYQCKINIKNTYIPASWTMTTIYDNQTGNHQTNVIAALNTGQNLVNHADHSNNDCMGTGYVHHNWLIYSSDMDALTNGNKQTILYSMGCDPAAFDVTNCIAEHFVRNRNGGGIAFIGNSRYGWYNYGQYTTLSMGFDVHFFKSLFQENLYHLGTAFSDHKNDGYFENPNDDYYKYIFTELTLLGDPELPVWTQNPATLVVSHPLLLPLGSSSFTVHVQTTGGSSIQNAYVCLWKSNEIYQNGYTNSAGNATFTVSLQTSGTMNVTVTKQNYLPSRSTVQVTNGNVPPNQPSSPFPINNTTNVSITSDMSWTGGDLNPGDVVTYDIYFGTNITPPRVINNQSGTIYDPGTLNFFTTYYWKIVAWDNHGAFTRGSLWRFTTKANNPPFFGTPSPANGSTNNLLNFIWTIPINDSEGNTFSWFIQCSNGQVNSGTIATNGTKSIVLYGLAYNTTYKVWVNATDPTGSGLYTKRWYIFTTKFNLPPAFGTPSPANLSQNLPTDFTWSIPINDLEGNTFTWSIHCSNGQTNTGSGATNGTKSLVLSGLVYLTTYKVWVNATDPGGSGQYTRRWYRFATGRENTPPFFGIPIPENGSMNQNVSISWSINISDAQGDLFSWTIQCSNGQVNSGTGASNGTKSLALVNLVYATLYKIWVNATDPTGSGNYTQAWFTFSTKEEPNSPPNKPNIPSGETSGKINTEYTYATSATDPNGDNVSFYWEWGDGTNSGWIGPSASGATTKAKHTWTTKGDYEIKVKTKDEHSLESDWTTLSVTMPYSYNIPFTPFIQFWIKLIERFPNAFPTLRYLFGR